MSACCSNYGQCECWKKPEADATSPKNLELEGDATKIQRSKYTEVLQIGDRTVGILDGWVKNPVLDLPRNTACMCGSGAKLKKCCLPKMPIAIKKDHPALADAWSLVARHRELEAKGLAHRGRQS